MRLLVSIAIKQLLARKRQSFVSLLGIILGVAFFLAIASLMIGSENDFIKRLVDNAPHVTIYDDFRLPRKQPVEELFGTALIDLSNVRPVRETRGIRNYDKIIARLRSTPGNVASAVLLNQALISFAGRDFAVTLNGMIPSEIKGVTSIEDYMTVGSIDNLIAERDGIVLGSELANKLSLSMADKVTIVAPTGQIRTFKIVGIFRTGRSAYDEAQAFVQLKRVQALFDRPRRINTIITKLANPQQAYETARQIENRFGYKSISWQEASEDIINTLTIRNIIMYTVVSAVLIVAAFGIYNVISTVVMEKFRDIAILKSMGYQASDVQLIFVVQGAILGVVGCLLGIPLGMTFMYALSRVTFKPPGATELINMPIDWGIAQFLIAAAFALSAAILAAYLPARKAGRVEPVVILRGGAW